MDLFFFVLPLLLVSAGYIIPGWDGPREPLREPARLTPCRQR